MTRAGPGPRCVQPDACEHRRQRRLDLDGDDRPGDVDLAPGHLGVVAFGDRATGRARVHRSRGLRGGSGQCGEVGRRRRALPRRLDAGHRHDERGDQRESRHGEQDEDDAGSGIAAHEASAHHGIAVSSWATALAVTSGTGSLADQDDGRPTTTTVTRPSAPRRTSTSRTAGWTVRAT
jgi:hypothetical protein